MLIHKKHVITLIFVLSVMLIAWTPSFSQLLFSDDFEYTDYVTDNDWEFWMGSTTHTFTTDELSHSGARSLFMDSRTGNTEERIWHFLDDAYTNVKIEVYMYDDFNDEWPYGYNHLYIDNPEVTGAFMGVRSTLSNDFYCTEGGGMYTWQITSIPRTSGWHKLTYILTGEGLEYYIDGILVRTSTHMSSIESVGLICGNHGYGTATGTVYFDDLILVKMPDLEIAIDIKPGSYPNSINLDSKGVLPVALLGSAVFDVNLVDQTTLELEGSKPRAKGKSGRIGSFEDVNEDGIVDLVVHFPTEDLQLTEDDTEASLTGELVDGRTIAGTDDVNIVPASLPKPDNNPILSTNECEPVTVDLMQNYPNPFNPETTIGYQLAEANHATVTIYNSLGAEVAVLVNQHQSQGFHTCVWNAASLPGGMYFYKIQAGSEMQIKKMLLLK